MNSSRAIRRVAIVGGGVSGLAAAHRLVELDRSCQVVLLEASDRIGGVLRTEHRDGFLIEHGADGFITNVPWAVDLCRRIGIDSDLLRTNSANRSTLVVSNGQLQPIPDGFTMMAPTRLGPIVTSRILSLRGKLRLACEPFIPSYRGHDESLASFGRRRLGREAYERLVQPLIGSIHTGDAEKLSMDANLPRFAQMEREHGSLVRAMWSQRKNRQSSTGKSAGQRPDSGARFSLFVAPRNGMQSLADALAASLPGGTIRLNAPVDTIDLRDGRWTLSVAGQSRLDVDALILATPISSAARLLSSVDQNLSQLLGQIPHSCSRVISLGYRRDQIAHPLDAFGIVVPSIEGRKLLCCSFSSLKYENRAPQGSVLLRAFVGGARQTDLLECPDGECQQLVEGELDKLLGISGRPICSVVSRPSAMPQYYVGHSELLTRIRARLPHLPGLELAGNAYEGVGVPQCIRSGEQAAERLNTLSRATEKSASLEQPALDRCDSRSGSRAVASGEPSPSG